MQLPLLEWSTLSAEQRQTALRRPAQDDAEAVLSTARAIIAEVRAQGDAALRDYALRFNKAKLASLKVAEDEFSAAEKALTSEQHSALRRAYDNVRKFHEAQRTAPIALETSPGVLCERVHVPIDAVGLYVPAGVAPLPSAALMLGIPADIAGCRTRVMCTPPRADGTADPAVLVAAKLCNVQHVFKIGGAEAIAAMAYGTESVPKVDKIFGPGSAWTTAAKQLVANDPQGAALDLPAGPSEVLVIADETARPDFVAADLLAQAEHSNDAQAILITTSQALAIAVAEHVERQMAHLQRRATLQTALRYARLILVRSLNEAFDLSNQYAPEHLLVQVENARQWLAHIRNAGSVFLGPWTPETMGDYCSGTNHVLPTYGYARAYSGLSLADFMKRMTVQELSPAGLKDLGPTAIRIAQLEGLDAHANAVEVRLAHLEAGADA